MVVHGSAAPPKRLTRAQANEKIHRPIGIGTIIGWMGWRAMLAGVCIGVSFRGLNRGALYSSETTREHTSPPKRRAPAIRLSPFGKTIPCIATTQRVVAIVT